MLAQDVEQGVRMVSFKGKEGFMYKANLSLRTALKILKPIYFKATNEQALYNFWCKLVKIHQCQSL
jgi:putative N6-adenine-specific DNA methylase